MKFNLEGRNNLQHYWNDFRKEPQLFSTLDLSGRSVKVWALLFLRGKIDLVKIDGKLDFEYNAIVLQDILVFKVNALY